MNFVLATPAPICSLALAAPLKALQASSGAVEITFRGGKTPKIKETSAVRKLPGFFFFTPMHSAVGGANAERKVSWSPSGDAAHIGSRSVERLKSHRHKNKSPLLASGDSERWNTRVLQVRPSGPAHVDRLPIRSDLLPDISPPRRGEVSLEQTQNETISSLSQSKAKRATQEYLSTLLSKGREKGVFYSDPEKIRGGKNRAPTMKTKRGSRIRVCHNAWDPAGNWRGSAIAGTLEFTVHSTGKDIAGNDCCYLEDKYMTGELFEITSWILVKRSLRP